VLDAGPSIKVTGPNGNQTIAANGGQITLAPGNYLSAGAYTLTGSGGANVGSFSAPYAIPVPPNLTSPASGPSSNTNVVRANGITFNWTGGAANSTIQIQGANSTDATGVVGATFTCFVPASAGTFTVPPSVLLALPPGSFPGAAWNFASYSAYGTFAATGLNHSAIKVIYATTVITTLQ